MPLNRFQIRNEYSLADPELYKVADKDDPEALLEGVAMAGLVGVLRQLGDLAEFAAEIFHDLHEEVMATASRGHGLIVRVQQLEAEFPSIERTLLSQTSHTAFLYNSGIDWHPNPRMDQSVVTRGDLPRFVMDSYEECRGPPRLFLLDKFDVAGAGACLKRFTDPSFFKMESTLSNGRKLEGQREKKTRRVKKRGPRWRNGDTPESFPSSHAKLHQLFLEERIESGINDPARRVKLKKRQFTGSMFDQDNVRSYMEKFLDTSPQEQKILHEICIDPLALTWTSNNVGEAGLEIVEIGTISPVKESMQTDGSLCSSPDAREMVVKPSMEDIYQGRNLTNDNEYMEVPGLYHESHDGSISTVSKALSGEEIIDKDSKSEVSVNDAGSEIDNYVDALANIESEVETDTEYKENPRYLNWKPFVTDSDGSERQRELHSVSLDSQSVGNSVISEDGDNFSKDRDISSCSNSVNTLNETSRDQEDAVMDVPTIQASISDSYNMSFDHDSTPDDILREERQKHAASLTVHVEVDNILKEQESGEALNTSFHADLKEVVMPVDLEDSLKNTHLPDLESEVSAKRDSNLEPQEHTNQSSYSPSYITYPDTSDDSGHCLSEPSNHDKERQNSNVYSGTSCDTSNISDGLGNLLETDSHNSACSSVEEHEKLLGMAVDACPDSGSPSKHLPISDPVNLEKTKLIDVAFEEGIYIPSTQENSKDLFCISDSSASFGMPELLPVTTDPVHVPSLDLAANSCSWQEPSLEDNIALSEESVFSTHVVQATTNSAIPNQLHICAQEFSSSEITEAVELTECDSLEADSAVASSRNESNCGNSRSADGIIVNDSVTVEKPSSMLEIQETQHEWLRIPSGSTDTATLELCEDVACIQDSRNDTCTGCFPFGGSNEDKADSSFLEREPDSEDFASIYSNQITVAEPETLVDDPAPQAAPMHGEHLVDRAPSDHHVDMEKIFSNDTSPLDKPAKHANDSDYVTTAENDSDLDHDTEKVKHIETVADGPEQVDVKDDSQENMITLSSSLSLHPENLQERPILVSEEFRRYDELTEEHRGEFTEIRQIYSVGDISVTSISNELSSDDSPSSLDRLQPEDVKTSGKIAEEAPLASDDGSEHIESSSSLQIPKHLNSLSHDLITPCYVERDESAGTAALHCDDQQTESKAAPQLSEHVLDTSDVVFHGNSMQNDAYKATQVENSEQPLSQQGFPDLRMRPTGPQINLEPPSLPPLPPMQWRLGRFQNSAAAAPVERRMMQHTLVPAQVQPMSLPTIRHNLAPVQPMTLPAMHHTLASFQPVPLTAGNSTFAAIPPATLPTTLPAVHYTFAPLRPVTLPTSDYGTETFAQTSTSDGQLGYSNGYMTQQGVFTLPMQVGVSDGFFQFNSNAVGRQDNLLSAVPLTSTNLNGYVTQQGKFPPSMPVMVSEGSSQIITSGVGGQNNVPFIASLSSTRPLEGISEEFCQAHSELNSLIEDHSSEHTSTVEAKVNFDTANQNELLRHSSQVLEEEAPNSYVQSILASAVDQPPPGLVAPDAGRTWLSDYDGISTHADGTTNGTLQKKPPRPRNPLIDEVVAIDKSKLRKVERVKPPLESKLEEGESLREQMQLRKVERVKLPMESKVEGENLIEQLQLRKVERVKPPVEQKAEEKEFLLEQLQLRKVSERVKPPVEQKSEGMEFSLEQLQLRKVREKPKQEVQPKVEETEAPPQAQLRKVSERFREEVELKVEETESPRVQLRKVPERENPLGAQNTEERDSLFEQIRNKSFNLKPAVATRPNIQGPRTNLKVAAILEKASNIRQAMAGSDEDDDADSWSDDS